MRGARSKGDRHPFGGTDRAGTKRQDLLRRFTPTPLVANLRLMQRTVRLETNSDALLELALKFFERHQQGAAGPHEFLWRIVCEPDPHVVSTDVPLSAFSDQGLRYVNIGQRGFLAVDLNRREATAFLADAFVGSDARFRHRPPLDILFCLTAPSLGLIPLSAGCVGMGDRGVLVFGPPNSGKTTSCYLAATLGAEFHADQLVFLDTRSDRPRAWGDLFPAVFRPETLDFLPELRHSTLRATYADLAFYYYDKTAMQAQQARPINAVCSLFLDRRDAGKTLRKEIRPADAVLRFRDCMLFDEDSQFDPQIGAAFNALSKGSVYELQYGRDPKIAADFIEKLLR